MYIFVFQYIPCFSFFSGSFLSWLFSSFLFWCSRLRKIICLVVSHWEHALKAFERLQCARMITMITGSRIIPLSGVHLGASHSQIFEERRSQDPVQFTVYDKTSRTVNRSKTSTYKDTNIIFSLQFFFFKPKIITVKLSKPMTGHQIGPAIPFQSKPW